MVKLARDVTLASTAAAALTIAFAALVPPAAAQSMPPEALRQACGGDVRKLCAGVKPGEGRIVQCLAAKPDQVSPACKSALQQAQAAKSSAK
ncbi:cysteine rich repeat-containing protein [Pseudolabrys sp. FHR47]|uniref:cysteine rich repeat-containing protein n=1 Tax=Pseudolabrys sp. FHR47 TaxID=2562284 RepID=UPI0010BE66AD|nr:cysteine rich repeat-containing protein [Pseudolabrys sp. FHR47]